MTDLEGRHIGEAVVLKLVAADAQTDTGRKALQEDMARQKREKRYFKEQRKNVEKESLQQKNKYLALTYEAINKERGFVPGSAPDPIIELQHTKADDALRERERLNKEGTFDYSTIAPEPRQPKKDLIIFPAYQFKEKEREEHEDVQNNS